MTTPIWAVSGFLGLSKDWDFLQFPQMAAVDPHAFPWNSLLDWGVRFNEWVSRQGTAPSLLMGYSLGGRLALHALLNNPKQWKGAVIISAHPGLSDPLEKGKRWQQDRKWAERFEKEEWDSLMNAWNQQEVFSHDPPFERNEGDYDRDQLVRTLLQGSLGTQTDLRHQISQLEIPLLWITGSNDHRFSAVAQSFAFKHPSSRWEKVEGAGHRVPWAKPADFKNLFHSFLAEFSST